MQQVLDYMKPHHHPWNHIELFMNLEIRPRTISDVDLLAPVDGTIASIGKISENDWCIHQIKHITYPVEDILGLTWQNGTSLIFNEIIPSFC
jgi:phosphatidylserine decarboxylase